LLVKFFRKFALRPMVAAFFAAAAPLLAPSAVCPQDLLMAGVIEVSGKLV
jgi:hypothetical protein